MTINRRQFAASFGAPLAAVSQAPGGLRAGAATADITPHLGVLLDGTIMQIGPAKHVHDELHARCLAVESVGERLAIVVCDCTMICREVFDKAKRLVNEQTGLPTSRMLMSATHNHSSPRAIGIWQGELDRQYSDFLARRIADAVRVALNNLAPARIGLGVGSKPEFVHNRRWILKPGTAPPNPFGERTDKAQMNPAGSRNNLVEPAGPVDPQVSVVSVQHADGRPLAVLANYGFHYAGGFRTGDISADYYGCFAARMGRLLGVEDQNPPFVAIMSNGTSGDVARVDWRHPPEPRPPYALMREIGDAMAEEVLRTCKSIQHSDQARPLAARETELELGVRRPSPARLAWAQEMWSKVRDKQKLSRPEVYAREQIMLAQYPPALRLKLQAFRMGELGIAAAPCEVFAETGLAIKRESALKPVFTIELANGYFGYLPSPRQHELGGYETWPARSSCLEVQAEPKIRAELLRLLKDLQPAA